MRQTFVNLSYHDNNFTHQVNLDLTKAMA